MRQMNPRVGILTRVAAAMTVAICLGVLLTAPALAAGPSAAGPSSEQYAPPAATQSATAILPYSYQPPSGGGTTWPCTVQVVGSRSGSTLQGSSYTLCNGAYVSTNVTITAYHCNFSLFGNCTSWDSGWPMTNGSCSNEFDYQLQCPATGKATKTNIPSGQLWKVQSTSCTRDVDGLSACGTVYEQVSF